MRHPLLFKSFADDARGSVSILFALACIMLFGVVGLAVDVARFHNLNSKIQDALDAAALAGARMLGDPDVTDEKVKEVTNAFFQAAIKSKGVAVVAMTPLNIDIDRTASAVAVNWDVKAKPLFAQIAGMSPVVDISQSSRVVFEMKKIELALVLDVTGSMNDKNKIGDMQSAAGDIIDQLMKNALNDDAVRIAVAPFSASVNAGVLADAVSGAATATRTCTWDSRYGYVCTDSAGGAVDSCVLERNGVNAATDAAPIGADALPTAPSLPYGHYSCPAAAIVPLQNVAQKDVLKDIINGYSASGATAGHIGAAWGFYLLSPNWAPVLPSGSVPAGYDSSGVDKTVVFMTDGLFNTSYINGGSDDAASQTESSYERFQELCTAAKDKKIQLYTVGFDLNDTRAKSELEACASSPSHFFDAQTGADLKKAFKTIADRLNNLRVAS